MNETVVTKTEPKAPVLVLWLFAIVACVFMLALAGPPNLTQHNEDRIAFYVHDAVENGHWICQVDASGDITSKPPLYTWLAGLATLIRGRLTPGTIYFPSALGIFALACIVYFGGRKEFGWRAGFIAALILLMSPVSEEHIAGARFDALFAATVAWAAMAAFRSWMSGRGWAWFWLAAAVATLAKGPLGVLLGGAGLLAALWEKRTGNSAPVHGSHVWGVALYFLIAAGWLALAYLELGPPVINKMIMHELVGQNVADHGDVPLAGFYKPILSFLSEFLPWSLVACWSFWRVWKQPATNASERRFERFLVCWFAAGLFIFALAAHQRSRLLLPLFPAAALLAARELDRMTAVWSRRRLLKTAGLVTLAGLSTLFLYKLVVTPHSRHVIRTQGMQRLALFVRERVGRDFPLNHVDSPFAFQFYLDKLRPLVPVDRAAHSFEANAAVFFASSDLSKFRQQLRDKEVPIHVLARWPESGEPFLQIISNHPRLELCDRMLFFALPFEIKMDGLRLAHARRSELEFVALRPNSELEISNLSEQSQTASLRIEYGGKEITQRIQFKAGETKRIPVSFEAQRPGTN